MPQSVVSILEVGETMDLESSLQPRGYRLLARVPRLPNSVVNDIVSRYASLQKVMRATAEDLETATGIEPVMARAVKDGLARLAESSILDRYS